MGALFCRNEFSNFLKHWSGFRRKMKMIRYYSDSFVEHDGDIVMVI